MKAQNKEEKLAKAQEREKLQREIALREKAERLQAEYEERFRSMQAEMERRQVKEMDGPLFYSTFQPLDTLKQTII